jgi:acetylornithine deacetylase/succinyl-diaminopimelate desuccinylase-like protein
MKGALAAQLFAVRAIRETVGPLPVNVMVGATVDDEIAGDMGQKYVLEQGLREASWPQPDLHLLGEANALNITGEFKGRIWIRLTLGGRTAHGGAPHKGVNAIEKMMEFLRRLGDLPYESHALLGADSINVGTIRGGARVNAVADECEVTLDIRFSRRSAGEQQSRIRELLDRYQHEDGSFTVNGFSVFESRDPVSTPPDLPGLGPVREAIRQSLGRDPEFLGTLSAGDAYHSLKSGIPAVWLGPGDINQLHAPNEHMPLEELSRAARTYAAVVLNYAGL